ncbi:MAG: acyl-CoA dehydratase activase [Nitrososphaerota archaeon]|jgi:benzoyl-CoA reductase subunit D|nr:acyl-CoA dehydratase activase [Nitrososphaerota archaeon]
MITVGLDIGTQSVKAIVLNDDDKILARAQTFSGFDPAKAIQDVIEQTLKTAGITQADINAFAVTGSSVELAPSNATTVSMMSADAKTATTLFSKVQTIIDVGAEEARAVKCDERGIMTDFVVNERCAAGAGTFIEAMARALEIKMEDMGTLSIKAERASSINASCVIFGESDVVSLIHKQEPKHEIARAVYDAMADRVSSMVHRLGINPEIVLLGGVAKDIGFVTSLKRKLGVDILIPEFPEYAGALGAALIVAAKERVR